MNTERLCSSTLLLISVVKDLFCFRTYMDGIGECQLNSLSSKARPKIRSM